MRSSTWSWNKNREGITGRVGHFSRVGVRAVAYLSHHHPSAGCGWIDILIE